MENERCPKCKGSIVIERIFSEDQFFFEKHCIHCGERFFPEDVSLQRAANKAKYAVNQKRDRRVRTQESW
jgi:hypothetical protein